MKKQLQKAFALWMAAILLLTAGCSKSRKNVSTSDVSPTETEAVSTDDDETMDYDTFSDIMNEIKARDYSNPGSSPYLMQDVYRLTYCELFSEKDMNEYAKKYTKSLKNSSAKKFARNLNMIYESVNWVSEYVLAAGDNSDESTFAARWGVSDGYFQRYAWGGFHIPYQEPTPTFEAWLEKFDEDELTYPSSKVELSGNNTADTCAIDIAYYGIMNYEYYMGGFYKEINCAANLMGCIAANADVPDEQLEEAVRVEYLALDPSERLLLDYHMSMVTEDVRYFWKNPDDLVWGQNAGAYDYDHDLSRFSKKKYDVFMAALTDVSHVEY